jgi:hypothetical protein
MPRKLPQLVRVVLEISHCRAKDEEQLCISRDKRRDRQRGRMLSKPKLTKSSLSFRRVIESMLHPGVRRTRVPSNRAWRQLVRHLFTAAAFADFLRLGSSFRLATNMLMTPNTWVESIRYHLSIAWSSSRLPSFPTTWLLSLHSHPRQSLGWYSLLPVDWWFLIFQYSTSLRKTAPASSIPW